MEDKTHNALFFYSASALAQAFCFAGFSMPSSWKLKETALKQCILKFTSLVESEGPSSPLILLQMRWHEKEGPYSVVKVDATPVSRRGREHAFEMRMTP